MTQINKKEIRIELIICIITSCIFFICLKSYIPYKKYFNKYHIPQNIRIGCSQCNTIFDMNETCEKCNSDNIQLYGYAWCDNCNINKNNADTYCSTCGYKLTKYQNLKDTNIDLNELKTHRAIELILRLIIIIDMIILLSIIAILALTFSHS